MHNPPVPIPHGEPAGQKAAKRGVPFSTRLKRLAGNLALAACSLVFICLVLEALLRIFAPQPLGLRFFSREGILLHYPGIKIRYTRPGFSTTVSTNSEGLRDREYAPGKPEGVFRILVLGDSFTEGKQVEDNEVWPKLVEETLRRERGGSNPRVELVNTAISGQGTADQIRYLDAYGKRWRPDLVLLGFYCGNDVPNNLSDRTLTFKDGKLDVGGRKPYPWTTYQIKKMRSWLGSHSHLNQFLRDRFKPTELWHGGLESVGLREKKQTEAEEWGEYDEKRVIESPMPDDIRRGWDLTFALLERMEHDATELGARFAIVVIPSRWMVDEKFLHEKVESQGLDPNATRDPTLPGRTLAAWAVPRRTPFFDLYPRFRELGVDRSYHHTYDAHWNSKGHATAARQIVLFLMTSGLLP